MEFLGQRDCRIADQEPVKVPEKAPVHHYGTSSQAADSFGHGNLRGEYSLSGLINPSRS